MNLHTNLDLTYLVGIWVEKKNYKSTNNVEKTY